MGRLCGGARYPALQEQGQHYWDFFLTDVICDLKIVLNCAWSAKELILEPFLDSGSPFRGRVLV